MDASPWSRCTHQKRTGDFCDAPKVPACPITLCARHLREANEFWCELESLSRRSYVPDPSETREMRKARQAEPEGIVYYVKLNDVVKIGFTTQPATRRWHYPPMAEFLVAEEGDPALEKRRHREFRIHLAAGREWFRYEGSLVAHVENLQRRQAAQPREPFEGLHRLGPRVRRATP